MTKELDYDTIINDIIKHIKRCFCSTYRGWYIGITNDPERRLKEHNVDMNPPFCAPIIRKALNVDIAREVEWNFLKECAEGGDGGGNEDSVFIYAYWINSVTKQ
jgi:hypothetical protein